MTSRSQPRVSRDRTDTGRSCFKSGIPYRVRSTARPDAFAHLHTWVRRKDPARFGQHPARPGVCVVCLLITTWAIFFLCAAARISVAMALVMLRRWKHHSANKSQATRCPDHAYSSWTNLLASTLTGPNCILATSNSHKIGQCRRHPTIAGLRTGKSLTNKDMDTCIEDGGGGNPDFLQLTAANALELRIPGLSLTLSAN